MSKWLPCRHCGRLIKIPARYAQTKSVAHDYCEAAAKAGVDFNAEPDLGDDFDELWAEFCEDHKARKAAAKPKPDDAKVPGTTAVTYGDLRRYAGETEDLRKWARANATDVRPWWAKLLNLWP